MSIQEIADQLVDLLRKGKFEEAQKTLFSEDAVSKEPLSSNIPKVHGLEAILKKGEQFRNSVEAWHGITVSDALVTDKFIAIRLKVELTFKEQEPSTMDELILYKVKKGKVQHEQFFY
ncbi:SnoaL-like domain-containing protein [Croceivirga thetidis]|uniref:Nuclear transport factor 2 family protein n=1 Tax=Croceivirga thetidis TaxID=2721623 RepID=A0ABX1GQS2_9FLAO|nr:SnoaL-like domain-containing protein [Croceivirga thetidis]NKI32259.1 nuclear transport factor 2 family protein [Croceivirga thetidis]